MKLLYISIVVLALFLAVWFFFVVPAERKHHERKLAALQKRIEKRESGRPDDGAGPEQPGN